MEQQAGLVNGAVQGSIGFDINSVAKNTDTKIALNPNKDLPLESEINDNPLVASDDDLIEKEWVERAKRIVQETHGNPRLQDDEVNKLQADYVNKRYAKKLGSS